jgi:hypothetical protein
MNGVFATTVDSCELCFTPVAFCALSIFYTGDLDNFLRNVVKFFEYNMFLQSRELYTV